MIPDLTREGLLAPGYHEATLAEVRRRFGTGNPVRVRLMKGLDAVLRLARKVGASRLYLDGSFVTAKQTPGDWDAVLLFRPDAKLWSKEALALADRATVKNRYQGDLFTMMEDDWETLSRFLEEIFV